MEAVQSERYPVVGDSVMFIDEVREEHNALVTAVWGPSCINVVYVTSDPLKKDSYGLQIERSSSVIKSAFQSEAIGRCWKFAE